MCREFATIVPAPCDRGGLIDKRTVPLRMSHSIGCARQMPSRVMVNLLDDGVVDTLGLVGATSGTKHFRLHRRLGRRPNCMVQHVAILLFEKPVNKPV